MTKLKLQLFQKSYFKKIFNDKFNNYFDVFYRFKQKLSKRHEKKMVPFIPETEPLSNLFFRSAYFKLILKNIQ